MARKRRARVRYHSVRVRGGHYGALGSRYQGFPMSVRASSIRGHRRRRTRRNPWYHQNPGKGTNWLLIGGIGVGAFLLLKGGALGNLFGGGVPAGYTAIGGNYYRGPDGALYQRSPTTGAMVRSATQAAPGSSIEQQLIAAGSRLAIPLIGGGISALGNWLGGLFTGGSATGAVPSTEGEVVVSPGDIFGDWGGGGGLAPLPELPDLGLSDWWNAPESGSWWEGSAPSGEPGFSLWGDNGGGNYLPDLPPLEPSVSISWVDPDFVDWSGYMGLGSPRTGRRLALAGYGRVLRRGPSGEVESRFLRAPASTR